MIEQAYRELSTRDLLALCIWRESDNQTYDAMTGVGYVIDNRVKDSGWWGDSIQAVVLHPWQFSSFNHNDPDSRRWPQDEEPKWLDACKIADDILSGASTDPTYGATSYYDVSIQPPVWTESMEFTVQLDKIRFYRKPEKPLGISA